MKIASSESASASTAASNVVLTVVALPIGHVDDLSPRARSTLESAGGIFCEDRRKLGELAKRAGLQLRGDAVVDALPGDSERTRDWEHYFEKHKGVTQWALVSDAGTPIVNDPGQALLDYARKARIKVIAIPGPSAPIAAWQWSGGFGLPFVFAGFAPKATSAGARELDKFFASLSVAKTFSFFDTRHQVLLTLKHLEQAGAGERRCFVAREITKPHEELLYGTVREIAELLESQLVDHDRLGELTFLIEGDGAPAADGSKKIAADQLVQIRLAPPREAAKIAAEISGEKSRDLYNLFLQGSHRKPAGDASS